VSVPLEEILGLPVRKGSRDSVVAIATRYGLDGLGIESQSAFCSGAVRLYAVQAAVSNDYKGVFWLGIVSV
jgi:hypothetical protein